MAAETMTAGELTNLRLGTLDGAVSDWEKMFAKLNTLATGEGGGASAQGLQTQTQAADWKGANATISRSSSSRRPPSPGTWPPRPGASSEFCVTPARP